MLQKCDTIGNPNQRLMSRATRTIAFQLLRASCVQIYKWKSTKNYNHSGVQLQLGLRAWCDGGVIKNCEEQHSSVIIQTDDGRTYQRNRSHVRKSSFNSNLPKNDELPESDNSQQTSTPVNTQTSKRPAIRHRLPFQQHLLELNP